MARVGWSARSSRCGSRPPAGRTSGVETLILGVGAVPFAVTTVDDVELLADALRAVAVVSGGGTLVEFPRKGTPS